MREGHYKFWCVFSMGAAHVLSPLAPPSTGVTPPRLPPLPSVPSTQEVSGGGGPCKWSKLDVLHAHVV